MQEVYHIEKLYTAQGIDLGRDYVEFPILQLTLLTYKRATEWVGDNLPHLRYDTESDEVYW